MNELETLESLVKHHIHFFRDEYDLANTEYTKGEAIGSETMRRLILRDISEMRATPNATADEIIDRGIKEGWLNNK